MTNGTPPRRPPPLLPPVPRLDQVRPIEERYAPPPGQRAAPPRPGGPPPRQQPGAHRRPPPRKSRSALGTVVITGLVIVGLVAAAGAAFVLLAPPTDLIRDQAIAAVKQRTGRDLVIRGPARLTFYPSLGVTLTDVSLSAPPAMGGTATVAMESLDVTVKLLPLLGRRVEVGRLVMTRPKFDLRVDKAGRKSWDIASDGAGDAPLRFAELQSRSISSDAPQPSHVVIAQRADAPPAATRGTVAAGTRRLAELDDVVLENVRIVDGTLDYADDRNAIRHTATSIDLTLKARTLAGPLSANGDLDWQGQTVRFSGTLTSLAEMLTNKPAKVMLDMSARPLEASYSGNFDLANGASLDGTVTAKSASLRALAQWAGKPLPANDGFGALALTGRLKTQPHQFRLDNADITLDGMRITGALSGLSGGTRPQIKADLKISEVNLDTYLTSSGPTSSGPTSSGPTSSGKGASAESPALAPTAAPAAKPASPPPGAAPNRPAEPPPHSIEDLLERPAGPRVKGYTARAGWSEDPINLAMLAVVDADARLSIGKLTIHDIKIGQSDVVLQLKDRVARTTLERIQLYNGSGRGVITLDATTTQPQLTTSLVFDNVAAAPLLKDAAGLDWLSGTGKMTIATTGNGASQRQLVGSLAGKASFAFTDGAISGFNVAKIVRGLGQGRLTGLSAAPTEKTDFSQLSASFDIAEGVATNKDLTLQSPLLRVSGDGRVMLGERAIDYTVRPKIVADATGQGGAAALSGIEVPVKITGSWDKPQIAPDLSKIDANQAVQAVQEIGKKLKGKDAGEVVDELFGKDSKESQKAKKFLDKLFR